MARCRYGNVPYFYNIKKQINKKLILININGNVLPMNREAVELDREVLRIAKFMDEMIAQGRLSAFECALVKQESEEVYRQVGYLDAAGKLTSATDTSTEEEELAISRRCNYLKRKKLIELHPEMEAELNEYIDRRRFHPLPPVPPELARGNAAFDQFKALHDFIDEKQEQGVLTNRERYAIYSPMFEVFEDSGVSADDAGKPNTDKALLVQAHRLMKERLLELHPELAKEVELIKPGRSR